MGSNADHYVSGGVNWASFTLEQLVSMVADKASVPQLERLADDWRTTGEGVVDAADYLADALDDLMDFWSGESADAARRTVALNAQWVGDLGRTAQDMGDPIDEAAGALRSAQETMPRLPVTQPVAQPGVAPEGAVQAVQATDGSPLGAAVGGTAAGSESAFQAQAEQEEMKRVAIETMQRFESAALGIDQATPQFEGQSEHLRPRIDELELIPGDGDSWVSDVDVATGVDTRWQVLTGMNDGSTSAQRMTGSFDGSGGGGFGSGGGGLAATGGSTGGLMPGPLSSGGTVGDISERSGGFVGGRGGMPTAPAAAGSTGGTTGSGMAGPMAPMGGGMGAAGQGGAQPHRRRVPFDADDPFDTGQKASPPVIGL